MLPNDVACDFCGRDWDLAQPMVEGLGDSFICVSCAHVAYGHLIRLGLDDALPGWICTMCQEHRDGPAWPSPIRPQTVICRLCVKRTAKKMAANPNANWRRP